MRTGPILVMAASIFLLGSLPFMIITRRQRTKAPGSFRCQMRVQSGAVPGIRGDYRYHRQHCFWIHDVLVIHRGRIFPRPQPVGVRTAEGIDSPDEALVTIRLRLDDGAVIRVMGDRLLISSIVGPFLTAELEHTAPRADS